MTSAVVIVSFPINLSAFIENILVVPALIEIRALFIEIVQRIDRRYGEIVSGNGQSTRFRLGAGESVGGHGQGASRGNENAGNSECHVTNDSHTDLIAACGNVLDCKCDGKKDGDW